MKKFMAQRTYFLSILILGVFLIAGCEDWISPDDDDNADNKAPTVISTIPADDAAGVVSNSAISATFSEKMDPATITSATFTVTGPGATPVAGVVAYSDRTAGFTPEDDLDYNVLYTATITTGAEDRAGNALASNYVWSFTAGAADTTAPRVIGTINADGATGVAINTKFGPTFSEAMNPSTITAATFTVTGPGDTPVAGVVSYTGITAVFTPEDDLDYSTTYTMTITDGAEDLAGNALASDYVWTFTTGAEPDTTRPIVIDTINADHATGVAVNTRIGATFSEAMNPLTITAATFTVTGNGGTPVAGVITYLGINTVFTPAGDLDYNTTYILTITDGAEDLAGNALASDYVWSFTTGEDPDTTSPLVTLTDPVNTAPDVAINKKISATFTEAMNPLTITILTFTMTGPGATPVAGTVSYLGRTAVFDPDDDLDYNTTYTMTITDEVEDLAGNAKASDYVWTFTTGAAPDTTAPIVTLTDPVAAAPGVAINKRITATFSEAMDPLTITILTFTVTGPGATPVTGAVTYTGLNAVFTPAGDLAYSTTYTATITDEVEDLAGNAKASDYVWTFTTGAAPDTTAPFITLTTPRDSEWNVILSKKVQLTFNEAMDPLTINAATFTLYDGTMAVPGTVSYVGLVATFTPTDDLESRLVYTASITTGAKDLAGNALAAYLWSFTTVEVLPLGPLPVDLGTAGDFVILTKTGITNIPTSDITGNIGTSPITGAAIAGLDCAEVTGTIYTVDAAGPACRMPDPVRLTAAIFDMEAAYVDAAGRTIPDFTGLGAGNISGMTLAPGLYKWSTGVLITNVGVTISGSADDVWIFQIAADLTVNNDAIVTLSGGAQAKNIFWQVGGGTGVAIGTGCAFEGNILATKAITISTGTALNGRALSQTKVTLQANTITAP